MVELHRLQLDSGPAVCWREWGAGQPLIMLHGWSMSSAVFSEVAPLLADRYRILCPDLPAHGESEPLSECTLAAFGEAIARWAEQLNLDAPALLGWSLGGQVAQLLASQQRLPLSRLLLISTTPRFCQGPDWAHGLPQTQLRALERNLGRAYEKTLGEFFNLQFSAAELSPERYREILKFAVRSSRLPNSADSRRALQILGAEDLRTCLPAIKVPTLVMHGRSDQIIPVAAGEYLADRIADSQREFLSDVGHAPFFSRPKDCVTRWREFLQ